MAAVKIIKDYTAFSIEGPSILINSGYDLPGNSAITGAVCTSDGLVLPGATFIQLQIGTSERNDEIATLDVLVTDPVVQDVLVFKSRATPTPITFLMITDSTLLLSNLIEGNVEIDFIVEDLS